MYHPVNLAIHHLGLLYHIQNFDINLEDFTTVSIQCRIYAYREAFQNSFLYARL